MKTLVHLALTSMMLIAAGVRPVEGQTLAEAARREAERRSKLQGPVKVYTSADVEVRPGAGTGPSRVETIPAAPVEARPGAAATPVLTDADAKKEAEPVVASPAPVADVAIEPPHGIAEVAPVTVKVEVKEGPYDANAALYKDRSGPGTKDVLSEGAANFAFHTAQARSETP